MSTAEIDLPPFIAADLLHVITDSMAAHPRSLQKSIGPSEIGQDCTRSIIWKLDGKEPPARGFGGKNEGPLIAGIGFHAWLAEAFKVHPLNQGAQPRWLIEHPVDLGQGITGTADLVDIDTSCVIDWKVVGKSRLNYYRDKGVGNQYRTQIHCYAYGLVRAQQHINRVMIVFLPRDGSLADYWYWTEPYDPEVATKALARIAGLRELIDAVGAPALAAMYPPCGSTWCGWCRTTDIAPF